MLLGLLLLLLGLVLLLGLGLPLCHFSRAIFDPKSGELKPGLEEWEKTCYCNTPPNPDLAYVQCDKCELWVHHDCIEKKEDAESETFICRNCKVQRR